LGVAPMSTRLRTLALATREALQEELGDERAGELRWQGANASVVDLVQRTRAALLGQRVSG